MIYLFVHDPESGEKIGYIVFRVVSEQGSIGVVYTKQKVDSQYVVTDSMERTPNSYDCVVELSKDTFVGPDGGDSAAFGDNQIDGYNHIPYSVLGGGRFKSFLNVLKDVQGKRLNILAGKGIVYEDMWLTTINFDNGAPMSMEFKLSFEEIIQVSLEKIQAKITIKKKRSGGKKSAESGKSGAGATGANGKHTYDNDTLAVDVYQSWEDTKGAGKELLGGVTEGLKEFFGPQQYTP